MRKINLIVMGILVSATIYNGCTKDPLKSLTIDESRIYITNKDSLADFASYKTYNISDSVAVLDNGQVSKDLTSLDQAYIDAVNKYMQQNGYMLVAKDANPDLGINVNRIYSTATGILDNGYWGSYGGYWDPYYWGYSGYGYYVPYSYTAYSVTEGAMSVDMLDLKNAAIKGSIDLIWTGLIRGEGIFDSSVADGAVKALFDQSTYLISN